MNLESYIKKNRDLLDTEKPDEEYLWTGISESMKDNKKHKPILLLRYVAAASVILILLLMFTYFIRRGDTQLIFVNMDSSLAKQEVQLKDQIESYSKLIKQTNVDTKQLETGSNEVQYIDDLISFYSRDLKQNGPNPKLIHSLMDLYQKKIMLLERMLNEIEKNKDHEKRKIDI